MEWNGEILKQLREALKLSQHDVAKGCNMGTGMLAKYENGVSCPSIDRLISLADFFAVPVDYLLGRTDDKEFWTAKAYSFRNRKFAVSEGMMVPWPYNLIDEIEPTHTFLSKDQIDGLYYAMDHYLLERQKDILVAYYRDEIRIKELADKYQVTMPCIRGYITKAVKKLRHPTSKLYIFKGLKRTEKYLKWLDESQERLATPISIGTLELPKSYHSLCKAGVTSVQDLLDIVSNGTLCSLEGFGVGKYEEVISELEKHGYLYCDGCGRENH